MKETLKLVFETLKLWRETLYCEGFLWGVRLMIQATKVHKHYTSALSISLVNVRSAMSLLLVAIPTSNL